MKNIAKNISVSILSLLTFFFIMEVAARTFSFFYSRDISSFKYGIDSSIKLDIRNKKINFIKDIISRQDSISAPEGGTAGSVVRIVTFGGSTTYGCFTGKYDSSWPAELEDILNSQYGTAAVKYEVLNLAANGSNTDYAVERLPFSKAWGKVDYILWAHFVNESDIMYFGPKRNIETLYAEFGDMLEEQDISFVINNYVMWAARIDKTLKKYSMFYNLFYRILHRGVTHAIDIDYDIVDEWYEAGITDMLISMALRNYEINFKNAKKYCDSNGIRLIPIRLPIQEDEPGGELRANRRLVAAFRKELDSLMARLSEQFDVPLIDVHRYYADNDFYGIAFYDNAHTGLDGNILTAEIIARELQGIFSKIDNGLRR